MRVCASATGCLWSEIEFGWPHVPSECPWMLFLGTLHASWPTPDLRNVSGNTTRTKCESTKRRQAPSFPCDTRPTSRECAIVIEAFDAHARLRAGKWVPVECSRSFGGVTVHRGARLLCLKPSVGRHHEKNRSNRKACAGMEWLLRGPNFATGIGSMTASQRISPNNRGFEGI